MAQRAHQRDRRQRLSYGNGMKQNAVWLNFALAIAIAFSPALAVGRGFAAAKQQT